MEKDKDRGGDSASVASENEVFSVIVTENGCGMTFDEVPDMIDRDNLGTKHCVSHAGGKIVLGLKMTLNLSKMSTGLPVNLEM